MWYSYLDKTHTNETKITVCNVPNHHSVVFSRRNESDPPGVESRIAVVRDKVVPIIRVRGKLL